MYGGARNMPKKPEKYFWLGIPVLFFAGSLSHFLYGLSGEMFAVGMIAPVNESIFEHAKMFPLSAAIWYGLIYLLRREKINADSWFTAALLSIAAQASSMLLLHYFYSGAFGLKSITADIITFLVSVSIGQIIGLH